MKNLRRVLTICMVMAMLLSMLVLSSCGLFDSKVEKMMRKIAKADSYTCETTNDDGSCTVVKVDFEKLVVCESNKDADGNIVKEAYLWYDEEADKYYGAEVEGDVVDKEVLDKDEFFDELEYYLEYDVSNSLANQVKWEVYEEEDGVFTRETVDGKGEDKETTVETIKVEDDVLIRIITETVGKLEIKTVYKTYDLNETEVSVPNNVLKAKITK